MKKTICSLVMATLLTAACSHIRETKTCKINGFIKDYFYEIHQEKTEGCEPVYSIDLTSMNDKIPYKINADDRNNNCFLDFVHIIEQKIKKDEDGLTVYYDGPVYLIELTEDEFIVGKDYAIWGRGTLKTETRGNSSYAGMIKEGNKTNIIDPAKPCVDPYSPNQIKYFKELISAAFNDAGVRHFDPPFWLDYVRKSKKE